MPPNLPAVPAASRPAPAPPVAALYARTIMIDNVVAATFSLTNISNKTYYCVDQARAFDWKPTVDWLGADGLQKPAPVRETKAGEEELCEGMVTEHRRIVRLVAGGVQNFGPITLNSLFDLSRPGVYVLHVSNAVFPLTPFPTSKDARAVSASVTFHIVGMRLGRSPRRGAMNRALRRWRLPPSPSTFRI